MGKITKTKLKIEGMHCTSCALLIDGDLEDLEGVKFAQTSFAKSECEVEHDQDQVTEQQLLETIKKTGYSGSLDEFARDPAASVSQVRLPAGKAGPRS